MGISAGKSKWRKRQRTVKLEFQCTACGHTFKRSVRKLFVDLHTFEKNRGQPQGRSPYVIPERILCPRCQAIDQFELSSSSVIKIQATILGRIAVQPDADDPIKIARFALSDGTPMHPLDALDMYAAQVSNHPERTDLRVKYANILRSLGYLEEAEVQYRAALERNPAEIEALMNLAALQAGRGDEEAAYDYLRRMVACAPKSRHPQRKEFVRGAQLVLDGEIKLEDFKVESPEESGVTAARRPSPAPRRAPSKHRKKKRRRSR